MESIQELLNSMQTKYKTVTSSSQEGDGTITLRNTRETWNRIANKDSFNELGFPSYSELDEFLRDWILQNPYQNLI